MKFLLNQADIKAILPTHGLVIFTKFHNYSVKIMDFSLKSYFWVYCHFLWNTPYYVYESTFIKFECPILALCKYILCNLLSKALPRKCFCFLLQILTRFFKNFHQYESKFEKKNVCNSKLKKMDHKIIDFKREPLNCFLTLSLIHFSSNMT